MSKRLLCLGMVMSSILILGLLEPIDAAEFFCPAGNVTCLIAAINSSNQNGQKNTINLEVGNYILTAVDNTTTGPTGLLDPNGLPEISSALTLQGAGAEGTSISRDAGAPFFRILSVTAAGSLTLNGLTIQGGLAPNVGGGVASDGSVIIIATTIAQNGASGSFVDGGGVFNAGTMSVSESTIAGNGTFHGGGGGITNRGTMSISKSTIGDNFAIDGGGGGIDNLGTLVIINSTIRSNDVVDAVGGGILNSGALSVSGSTIADNSAGGGVSTGAGIVNIGTMNINGSTIAGNSARGTPFPGTRTGGIINDGVATLQNTILALNTSDRLRGQFGEFQTDCSGTITSLGNNLIGDLTSCTIALQKSDLTGDPGLGDFIDDLVPGHGRFPLLAGSQAIDAGNDATCSATDQLGLPRLGVCDRGSVEFQGGRMMVSIDIRPRKDANRINPSSSKSVNVAIFSANGFDATAIDAASARFGATGTEAAPIHVHLTDIDGDGHRDMVLRFQIQETGIQCGDTSSILTGQIASGQPIIGSSPISTVQCKQQRRTVAVGSH